MRKMRSRQTWVYLFYWILVTAFFAYDAKYLIRKAGLPHFFICAVFRISVLITIGWLNIHWLIPRYLLVKKYAAYFLFSLLLVIAYLVIQSAYDHYLFGFLIGHPSSVDFSVSLIYNFTHTSFYLLVTVALKFSIDWYAQQQVIHKINIEKLQAEVNYLRSQVNPHFLFNALNNLYALTLQKSDLAPNVVLKLSAIMEYMLYESDEALVSLEKEMKYLSDYLELEKLRQQTPVDIKLEINGDTGNCKIPPFLLLPLVENAVKHGITKVSEGAFLHITITVANQLLIRVVNNKPAAAPVKNNGGIGLSNLSKRLELLYPGKHSLTVNDQPDYFEVLIKTDCVC
jgi:two-component system LytT family sensor kinase